VQESTVLGLLMLMADKDSRDARTHGLSALLSLLEHAPEVSYVTAARSIIRQSENKNRSTLLGSSLDTIISYPIGQN
jgi:hypothetical protein